MTDTTMTRLAGECAALAAWVTDTTYGPWWSAVDRAAWGAAEECSDADAAAARAAGTTAAYAAAGDAIRARFGAARHAGDDPACVAARAATRACIAARAAALGV